MGCTQTKGTVKSGTLGTARKIKRTHSHEFDTIGLENLKQKQLEKLEEDERIREEAEKDFARRLIAEKKLLRAKAQFMIEQKSTWDSLLSQLSANELNNIRGTHDMSLAYRNQQIHKRMVRREESVKGVQHWMIFNNLDAISETDLNRVAFFMQKVLTLLTQWNAALNDLNDDDISRSRSQKIIERALRDSEVSMDSRISEHVLSLCFIYIQPFTSREVNVANLYDFDLPSGLICVGTAACIMDLYRKGGRLSMGAVHKLLRLGYASLKQLPNISYMNLSTADSKITVVGDLHGQLYDLLHIIDSSGLPSPTNKYIFNGDFIDRGQYGVEVMCILIALHCAMPDQVFLNRGNHEDFAICNAYGFQVECLEKYDDITFGMFMEVFQHIPMFTIVDDAVFIVHGGLFHHPDVSIADLQSIQRADFTLLDMPEGGETTAPIPRNEAAAFLTQLQRDALWSDPIDKPGLHTSARGAGVQFGPDVARHFLEFNNLQMIIRSHECIRSGFYQPYSGDDQDILCTIFSASDYGGAGNSAAYMVLETYDPSVILNVSTHGNNSPMGEDEEINEPKYVPNTNILYNVHYYYINCLQENDIDNTTLEFIGDDDVTVVGANEGNVNPKNGEPKEEEIRTDVNAAVISPFDLTLKNIAPTTASSESITESNHNLAGENVNVNEVEITEDNHLIKVNETLNNGHSHHTTNNNVTDNSCHSSSNGKQPKAHSDNEGFFVGSTQSLFVFILNSKAQLFNAFLLADILKEGLVSVNDWILVMRDTLHVDLKWSKFVSILISPSHYRFDESGMKCIAYVDFLNSFSENLFGSGKLTYKDGLLCTENGQVVVESLPPKGFRCYNNISREMLKLVYLDVFTKLEEAFDYFDDDDDGFITKEDIHNGFAQLMKATACSIKSRHNTDDDSDKRNQLTRDDIDHIVDIIDLHGNGQIDINIFFEVFRICNGSNACNFEMASTQLRDFSFRREKSFSLNSVTMNRTSSIGSGMAITSTGTTLVKVPSGRWHKTGSQDNIEMEGSTMMSDVIQQIVGITVDADEFSLVPDEEKAEAEDVGLIIDI